MSEDLETAAEEASGFIQERAKVDASPIELAGWSEAIAITGKRFPITAILSVLRSLIFPRLVNRR